MANNESRILYKHKNKVSQKYKPGKHLGIDIIGDNGISNNTGYLDKIVAHSCGEVVAVERNIKGFKNNSYGNYVKIKHYNGMYTLYAHMEYGSVHVVVGDQVIQGEIIGNMGNTGYSFGAHVHFEVRDKNNKKLDPTPYINADLPNNAIMNDNASNITNLSDNELLILVKKTIRGDFGDHDERKANLGNNFSKVQYQVNLNFRHNTITWDTIRLYD